MMGASAHKIKIKTINEYAEMLGTTPRIVRDMCINGKLPARRIGSSWRILDEGKEITLEKIYRGKDPKRNDLPEAIKNMRGIRDLSDIINICFGVYFLCKGKEVVYVGQSRNLLVRISNHKRDKDFDRIFLYPCDRDDMDGMEGAFIKLLAPKLNGRNSKGKLCGPIAADEYMQKARRILRAMETEP